MEGIEVREAQGLRGLTDDLGGQLRELLVRGLEHGRRGRVIRQRLLGLLQDGLQVLPLRLDPQLQVPLHLQLLLQPLLHFHLKLPCFTVSLHAAHTHHPFMHSYQYSTVIELC